MPTTIALPLPPCCLGVRLDSFLLVSRPPIYVSSASTWPLRGVLNDLVFAASRRRCRTNQADFWVIPRSFANCVLAMPFLCEVISQIASIHVRSGSLVPSKIVPTLIENRWRQSPHLWVFLSEK